MRISTGWIKRGLLAFVGLLVVIQLVPYGHDHSNPTVAIEPAWDSPVTRELAVRACFDFRRFEVVWPWYVNVAALLWLVQRQVDEGRDELNFSEWHLGQEGDEAAETVRDGSMPPREYLWTHPDARLTDAELDALAAGFAATLGDEDSHESEDGDDD